jgi:hypothetical protein
MSHIDNLGEINRIIEGPLARYDAVMGIAALASSEFDVTGMPASYRR